MLSPVVGRISGTSGTSEMMVGVGGVEEGCIQFVPRRKQGLWRLDEIRSSRIEYHVSAEFEPIVDLPAEI